jgi:hypothetical protein
MADYYSLLARAIAGLPQPSAATREAVYDRARAALFRQLRAIQPPMAEADIAAEGKALDEAIARVEQDVATKAAVERAIAQPPAPRDAGPRDAKPLQQESGAEATAQPVDEFSEPAPREPQRPAAPLPPTVETSSGSRRFLGIAAVLVALMVIVGAAAWHFRERPEDLAKLKPEETTTESAAGGKFADRVPGETGEATPGVTSSAAPHKSERPAIPLPVAQKAELWVASAQEPQKVDRVYAGTVVWKLDNVGGAGAPVASAIRGDVDVPDSKLKLTIVFQKNLDATLSASHTVNVTFNIAPGSDLKGVKAIGTIQMRRPEAQSGEKIAGVPVSITENTFLIGLMRGDREARNIQMLRSLMVLDLPMQLTDGRMATINLEKGPAGERVFADAIEAWSQK